MAELKYRARVLHALKVIRENCHVLGTTRIEDQAIRWAAIQADAQAASLAAALEITNEELGMSFNADDIYKKIIGDFKAEVPALVPEPLTDEKIKAAAMEFGKTAYNGYAGPGPRSQFFEGAKWAREQIAKPPEPIVCDGETRDGKPCYGC